MYFLQTLEQQDDDPLKKLAATNKMVSCRYCKGEHWSSKCPYKDTLGATSVKLDEIICKFKKIICNHGYEQEG